MLKLTATPPPSAPDLRSDFLALPGLAEVLIEHRDLSRVGNLDDDSVLAALQTAKDRGLRTVLVWDILAGDAEIAEGATLLNRFDRGLVDAIRVQDPGIAAYLDKARPRFPIQLVLETGNHNREGLQAWIQAIQPERIVLSNELPIGLVKEMRPHLHTQLEIQVMGRILLFYTPRQLLTPLEIKDRAQTYLEETLTSEEDHKRFPIIENHHGTFMYYEKDLFLLPFLSEIEAAGIEYARLDLKFYRQSELIPTLNRCLTLPAGKPDFQSLKVLLRNKLTRGFFKSNRTDKQFAKLKNPHLRRIEEWPFLGDVLETGKKQYLAVHTRKAFEVGDQLSFVIPEGRRLEGRVEWISNASGERVDCADPPGLWLINHIRRVSPGAKIYTSPKQREGHSQAG